VAGWAGFPAARYVTRRAIRDYSLLGGADSAGVGEEGGSVGLVAGESDGTEFVDGGSGASIGAGCTGEFGAGARVHPIANALTTSAANAVRLIGMTYLLNGYR
jgi:hypothetical protein